MARILYLIPGAFFVISASILIYVLKQIANGAYIESFTSEPLSTPYLNLSDPEVVKREVEKIKLKMAIDYPITFSHNQNNYTQNHTKKLRNLASSNVLETKTGMFSFDEQGSWEGNAWKFIGRNARHYYSKILLYPYSFTYNYEWNDTEKTHASREYPRGAVFSLNPSDLNGAGVKYLVSNTTIKFNKAKALYDMDIAIFKENVIFPDFMNDVFYDSDSYCTFIGSTFKAGKQCLLGIDQYEQAKKIDPTGAFIVFISHTDLQKGILLDTEGEPQFGAVIIPDHIFGSEDVIISLFQESGKNQLKNFVAKGGHIIATGKSGYLLQKMGLLENLYDKNRLLVSRETDNIITLKGCESSFNKTYSQSEDFVQHLMCQNAENRMNTYLTSSYYIPAPSSLNTKIRIDPEKTSLKFVDGNTGMETDPTEAELRDLPLVFLKEYQKGDIFVIQANPVALSSAKATLLMNTVLHAMSNPLYMNSWVKIGDTEKQYPIPAGEAGVNLDTEVTFYNLDDKQLKNFVLHVVLPNKVEFVKYDESLCVRTNETVRELEGKSLNFSEHLVCKLPTLDAYEARNFTFKVTIIDYTVTQRGRNILILYPIAFYEDTKGVTHFIDQNGARVDAAIAAVLRGSLNPDPSAFYPIPGEGTFVDNVLKVENKESTEAFNVSYYGVIPLISPVTDMTSQASVARTCQLYDEYYTSNGYKVPFLIENVDFDYVDVKYLNDKDVVIVAEWDSPVKTDKISRAEQKLPNVTNPNMDVNIENINWGAISVNSTNDVIQQISFRNADIFYMHASQRLMAFIDTAKVNGSKVYYPNGIPQDWKRLDPTKQNVARKEFLFVHNDIYFYDVESYQHPEGINSTIIFSVDNYPKSTSPCVKTWGDAKSEILVKGYFDHTKPKILKPHEWSNELFQYCDMNQVDPTKEEEIKKYNLTDVIRGVHYIFPIVDKSITRPSDLYGFKEINTKSGYLEKYPSVKFIYAHSITVVVPAAITRQGGKIEVSLKGSFAVKTENDITMSPDQVAFYKTECSKDKKSISLFFKRGLLSNEAYGKDSVMELNIENIDADTDIEATVNIYEVKFDISSPETQFETYNFVKSETKTFKKRQCLSLPAVEIRTKLNREGDSTLDPYEMLEPFTRYGVYIQELIGHRTIWGKAESHHQTRPGLQSISDGFSTLSNLGISSIPFIEYVTSGTSQVIPGSLATSRIEWNDVWGRTWRQPLRTLFPDVPPGPGPFKNFMMSTTYEVLIMRGGKPVRSLVWPSDEEAQIHLHLKLLNNYEKFFEITRCKENELVYIPKKSGEVHDREFGKPPYDYEVDPEKITDDKFYLSKGGRAKYGQCFSKEGTYLEGQKLTKEDFDIIKEAELCADSINPEEIKECAQRFKDNKTVRRRKEGTTGTWMYSPSVDEYYPEGYIQDDMWDMTHVDYDDDSMNKAYKYHMDNNLPNLDNPNLKPSNTIMQPIFKGVGYIVDYNPNKQYYKDSKFRGWWSDNLQNKDETLLAGIQKINKISVDKSTLLPDNMWINIRDLKGINQSEVDGVVANRLRNIYACLFNQHRVKVDIKKSGKVALHNVNQNNIVPIIPDLEKDDPRLYNFNCTGVKQYTPYTISQVDNVVKTPTDKDYLYFAANIRGGARENIHVLATLKPFPEVIYEDTIKVNEGGRFVYWNPANGPNSYEIVDNAVNVMHAKRNELALENEVFPRQVTTFNATTYHLYSIEDLTKDKKEWPFSSYYIDSYGFGDSTVSIYVGGIKRSRAVIKPGDTTYAKITFFNNAGFDWNMLFDAMDYVNKTKTPTSAHEYLERTTHTVRVPTKYNFLITSFEEKELSQYITIEPSDHNVDVAPEFFDFGNINVATIRDGFKGEYYYKITVSKDIPQKFQGRPMKINVTLNESLFDSLPGHNDPTKEGFHDYHLQIPQILIAVPYQSGEYQGKVFYTSSYSTDLKVQVKVENGWEMQGFKYITQEQILELREKADNKTEYERLLREFWEKLDPEEIPFAEKRKDESFTEIEVDPSKRYPHFPIATGRLEPDCAKFYMLGKAFAPQVPHGSSVILSDIFIQYTDFSNKIKKTRAPYPYIRYITAKGAWLAMNYVPQLVTFNQISKKFEANEDQRLFRDSEGVIEVNFTLFNRGDQPSYYTNYSLIIQNNVTVDTSNLPKHIETEIKQIEDNKTLLIFYYKSHMQPGDRHLETIYLNYYPVKEEVDNSTTERDFIDFRDPPKFLPLVKEAEAQLQLLEKDKPVKEKLKTPLTMSYAEEFRERVKIEMTASWNRLAPTIKVEATPNTNKTKKGYEVKYAMFKILPEEENSTWTNLTTSPNTTTYSENPFNRSKYKVFGEAKVMYKIDLLDENRKVIASSRVMYDSTKIGLSKYDYYCLGLCAVMLILSGVLILCTIKVNNRNKSIKNDEVDVRAGDTKGTVKAPDVEKLLGDNAIN